MDFWTSIGVILTGLIALRFISQLGKSLPILELMLFIAAAQWIIGPLIEYNAPSLHYKYFMYVDQQRYMSYVVPAFGAFSLAVLLGIRFLKDSTIPLDKLKHFKDYGVTIFVIGVFFDLIGSSLPAGLAFLHLLYLILNLRALLYFSSLMIKDSNQFFYASLVFLLFRAIQSTMFHDFILWTAFFTCFGL